MREIEKGLLLAELINPDCIDERQISSFVSWIRNQDCYHDLVENMNDVKKSSSILARCLYHEFELINLDKVSSIEEAMIAYYKILYLVQLSTPAFYLNPLLAINKKEKKIRIGDVLVKFNNKYIPLDEFSLDAGFAFQEKLAFIKEKVSSWEDDVYNRLIKTIRRLKDNPRNLPKRRVFSIGHIILGLLYIALIAAFVVVMYTNNQFFSSVHLPDTFSKYTFKHFIVLFSMSFVGLGSIIYIVEMIYRAITISKYRKIRNLVFDKEDHLLKIIQKQGDKLQNYLIKNVEKHNKLDLIVDDFSDCLKIYEYLLYLYHINYHCKKIEKDRIWLVSKIVLSLVLVFVILLTVYFVYAYVGGAK